MTLWWFSFSMASLSCASALVALWCWYRVRKLLEGASVRSLAQLSNEVAELMFVFESLQAQHKRLNARVGMREARAKLENVDAGGGSGSQEVDRQKLKEIARARGFKVS